MLIQYMSDLSSNIGRVCFFAFLLILTFIQSGYSQNLEVPIDQARLLPLERNSAAVIVGNPSIADVSVQNSKMLVVTGKSFGSTNVIVLDSSRKVVLDKVIRVVSDAKQVVSLYKGSVRQSYNCGEKCNAILTPSDGPEYFKNTQTAVSNKFGLVAGGSPDGGQQGGQ